jgi:hypothetical protein
MPFAATVDADESKLEVRGDLGQTELRDLLANGRRLLDGFAAERLILDMRRANTADSSFIGTVAELALEAKSRSKELVVCASGRAADWLVWAGLHKIAGLDVSATRGPRGAAT